MALQMIYVDDAAPGACGDAGMVYNGTTTITSSKIIAGTSMTMSGTAAITGATTCGSTLGVTGNVAVNTDKFTVAAASGNTTIAGTLAVNNAISMGSVEHSDASGALAVPLTDLMSTFVTNGTAQLDLSLADGSNGQMLIVQLATKDTNNAVLTPAHAFGFSTITFDASGELAMMIFVVDSWHIIYTTATVA